MNAIKFGALSTGDKRRRLLINWTCKDGRLTLDWQEEGVPVIASEPMCWGFGRDFIERALPYQAAATTRFELKPGGLSCAIEIPLHQDVADTLARAW